MISSRRIDDLHPRVAGLALRLIDLCHEAGIDLLIYCTYRDNEAQDAEYAKGRTVPGKIVTNAKAGDSWHQYRLAFDAVPVVNGKAKWNDNVTYETVARLAESIGLQWAGRWKGRLRERAHFQYSGGLTLDDLQAGKRLEGHA